jgi:hypothetical protein
MRLFVACAKALLIALALILLGEYFGWWHVREAGGAVARLSV